MDNLNYIKKVIRDERESNIVRNYNIGRNEPCPCGSGRKFKKCCGSSRPDKTADEYYAEVKSAQKEEEVLKILKDAVKDYPLKHSFLLPLIVYSLQNGNYEDSVQYLKHAWQLMGTDLNEAFIAPLINILLDENEVREAEKIARESLEEKGESIPLLIGLAEVYKKEDEIQRVNDIIKRAVKIDEDNPQLIIFRLETLMDLDDVVSALALFNKYYDKLKDYRNMRVVDFLEDFVKDRFNLAENKKLRKKEALEKAVKIFSVFEQIDNLKLKSDSKEVLELLESIKDMPPQNSQAVLDVLSRYLAAELYTEFDEFADQIAETQYQNPEFIRLLYLADLNQGNIAEAEEKIKTAFEIEKNRSDGHFHGWDIAADYLRYTVDYGKISDLHQFINEFEDVIDESDNLLEDLMTLINTEQNSDYRNRLLEKLLKLSEEEEDLNIISIRDIYNNLLFINLAALDGEEIVYKSGSDKTAAEINNIIEKIENTNINTPVLDYAKLRLLSSTSGLKEEEKKRLLEKVESAEIESYFDTVAYYETLLRFGDPASLITEIPYGNYLDDDFLDFYRLTAALMLDYHEIASELFHKQLLKNSRENNLMRFLIRLIKYFELDELLEHFKTMDVSEEIYNYLVQLHHIPKNS